MTAPAGGAPDGAAAGQAPAQPTAAPAQATPPAAGTEPAVPSHGDWAAMAKTQRDLFAQVAKLTERLNAPAQPAAPEPAKPSTLEERFAQLEGRLGNVTFDLDLERAINASKLPDGPLRELIVKAAKAEKPNDIGGWLSKYAGIGASAPIAPAAPPAPAVAAPTVPPPAGSPTGNPLPDNPLQWPPDVIAKMSNADYRKALTEYDAKRGGGHPLKHLRRR